MLLFKHYFSLFASKQCLDKTDRLLLGHEVKFILLETIIATGFIDTPPKKKRERVFQNKISPL